MLKVLALIVFTVAVVSSVPARPSNVRFICEFKSEIYQNETKIVQSYCRIHWSLRQQVA